MVNWQFLQNRLSDVLNLYRNDSVTVCIGGRPVKLVAVYLSPLRSLVDADLFGGGTPVLLAGDLNAKHKDWNSRLNSPRGVLLREFASTNSCIVFGPVSPTSIHTVILDVLDIVVVKNFVLPVNRTVCSALSSDHFPVTIDFRGRSSFQAFQTGPA